MALRTIRVNEDPILRKQARRVDGVNDRIKELVQDMLDTMYEADGVGLAAPQIGVLRRVVAIDVGEGPLVMINPVIIHKEGEQIAMEGCLSLPGVNEKVLRPHCVTVKYQDIHGKEKSLTGESMLARAICHEVDHLDGILFTDKIIAKEIK
ncbi:MAG: peptide deformylase [Eubacteriales bacterium]